MIANELSVARLKASLSLTKKTSMICVKSFEPNLPKWSRKQGSISRGIAISLLGIAVALSGCASVTATAPEGAQVSQRDLEFITNVYNVADFDKLVIGQLLTKEPRPQVGALAKTMLAEAKDFEARVGPIAIRKGIRPPLGQRFVQRADLQARIASVIGSNSIDYEQEFLSDEIFSHKLALTTAQLMSHEPGGDPELAGISEDATRVLSENLTRLEDLRSGEIQPKTNGLTAAVLAVRNNVHDE